MLMRSGHTIECEVKTNIGAKRHKFDLLICGNPTCPCALVHLEMLGTDREKKPVITLDIGKKELAEEDEGADVGPQIIDAFTDDDWRSLRENYRDFKAKCSENVHPEDIDVTFPINAIERQGQLVYYAEILPYAEPLKIEVEGSEYWLRDMYCLSRSHPCAQVNLEFIPVDLSKADHEQYGSTILCVDYEGELIEEVLPSSCPTAIPKEELLRTLKKRKDIMLCCKQRHATLRKLYDWHVPSERIPVRTGIKTGRNDPCPCGSGKKYKKCCLATGAAT